MTDTTIRIPLRFYQDHEERDLPTPTAIRQTKRHVWIDLNDEHVPELMDDADYYKDEAGFDGCAGICRSARATLKAIAAHATWERKFSGYGTSCIDFDTLSPSQWGGTMKTMWTPDMSGGLTIDRSGNPWKVYRNGKMLCARSHPYHSAYNEKNGETDGPCDCDNREGETIGEYVLDGNGIRRVK